MKTQSSSSRGFYDRILSDHEAKVAPYRAKLEKSSQTWTALQQQQAYLQQQLKAVEAEMAAEQSRTAALQSALATLQTDHEKQIGALNSSQSHVLDALEKDKQMRGLIDTVRAMESVVDDVVLIGLRSVGTRSDGVLSSRLPSVPSESLIASFLAYAASEAACVDILAKRVCLMKEKSVHLHREVAEYKNLGMQVCPMSCERTMLPLIIDGAMTESCHGDRAEHWPHRREHRRGCRGVAKSPRLGVRCSGPTARGYQK